MSHTTQQIHNNACGITALAVCLQWNIMIISVWPDRCVLADNIRPMSKFAVAWAFGGMWTRYTHRYSTAHDHANAHTVWLIIMIFGELFKWGNSFQVWAKCCWSHGNRMMMECPAAMFTTLSTHSLHHTPSRHNKSAKNNFQNSIVPLFLGCWVWEDCVTTVGIVTSSNAQRPTPLHRNWCNWICTH